MLYFFLLILFLCVFKIENILKFFYYIYKIKRNIFEKNVKTITVTGSYGKTSTCFIINHILKNNYNVHHVKYNSYFGIRVSLMGINIKKFLKIKTKIRWLYLFFKLIYNTFFYFPKKDLNLIEVGIDNKNMIEKVKILPRYEISLLTSIDYVHSKQFNDIDEIFDEKIKLINNLLVNGMAIINYDNPYIFKNIHKIKRNFLIVTKNNNYLNDNSGLLITNCESNLEYFKMEFIFMKNNYILTIKNLINSQLIPENYCYNLGMAILACYLKKINIIDAIKYLEDFKLPNSRSNIINVYKSSFLIDSSYNSSFFPLKTLLFEINKIDKDKILILGDMVELGDQEKKFHQELGNIILKMNRIKIIILIGNIISNYTYEVLKNKKIRVHRFKNVFDCNLNFKNIICFDNLIFVKGSNSIKLKEICNKIIKI